MSPGRRGHFRTAGISTRQGGRRASRRRGRRGSKWSSCISFRRLRSAARPVHPRLGGAPGRGPRRFGSHDPRLHRPAGVRKPGFPQVAGRASPREVLASFHRPPSAAAPCECVPAFPNALVAVPFTVHPRGAFFRTRLSFSHLLVSAFATRGRLRMSGRWTGVIPCAHEERVRCGPESGMRWVAARRAGR